MVSNFEFVTFPLVSWGPVEGSKLFKVWGNVMACHLLMIIVFNNDSFCGCKTVVPDQLALPKVS